MGWKRFNPDSGCTVGLSLVMPHRLNKQNTHLTRGFVLSRSDFLENDSGKIARYDVDSCFSLRTIVEIDNRGGYLIRKCTWSRSLSNSSIWKSDREQILFNMLNICILSFPINNFFRYLQAKMRWHFRWCLDRLVEMYSEYIFMLVIFVKPFQPFFKGDTKRPGVDYEENGP